MFWLYESISMRCLYEKENDMWLYESICMRCIYEKKQMTCDYMKSIVKRMTCDYMKSIHMYNECIWKA